MLGNILLHLSFLLVHPFCTCHLLTGMLYEETADLKSSNQEVVSHNPQL